jgi:hypothetical protein
MEKVKHLILLDDYKRGFSEIEKLVNSFEGITNGSQNIFIHTREQMLHEQKDSLLVQREILFEKIKKALVKYNSEILTLVNIEEYLDGELSKCQQVREEIEKADEIAKENEERANTVALTSKN